MRAILLLSVLILASCQSNKENSKMKVDFTQPEITYPETRQDDVVDDYHGESVADPYRWLEDDNSAETKDWVKRQNKVTDGYLANIPFKKDIAERLKELWNYTRYSSPFKEGDMYYYYKNDGLQNQNILYKSKDIKSEGEVFLDPNKFSDDGTTSLAGLVFNKVGDKAAYMVSEGGSDWRTAYVMDKDGNKLNDKLEWLKFSGLSWAGDGFYYSRYPEPKEGDELSASNSYHSLYYHKIGDSQDKDELVFVDRDHAQRNVYAGVTDDERFLVVTQVVSTEGNTLKVLDRSKPGSKLIDIVNTFTSNYNVIDSDRDELLVLTNDDAPLQRVISININRPQRKHWKTIIPESDNTLRSVSVVGGKLFANYLENASSKIKVYELGGKFIADLKLPGIGSSAGVTGKKDGDIGFYSYSSYTTPSTIYKLNTETLDSEVFRAADVDIDQDLFETKQVWYTSKDGTKVPMFVTMKKGLKLDGSNPTLLFGYGGFNIPRTPGFSLTKLPFLENGGIYVVANIRGGGEFGKEWHTSGTKEQKQNVFDDFIAAAEYLIDNKYTSKEKLAIEGGSNGGLLVGACMTQRPDLFQVAFPRVGVLDMLRYHQFTIGWAWAGDYGRSDDPEAYKYLKAYSPLHNVKPAAYPATMVMTADHDDRVVPAHSFKFAAELQKQHNGPNPVMIRVESSAGHGAGKPTDMAIEEAAALTSFMLFNMKESYGKQTKG